MNNVMQVPVADIILDPRLQMRETMDFAVIDDYAEHLFDLPPGKIVMGEGGIMWLTGGWHRYHANVKAKQTTMPCTVREGTFQDALKEAAGENFGHGIRRTDADKKRAVKALLSEPLWADRSDRMIAEACHVSHPLVAKVRAEMAEANSQSQSDKEDNSSGNASNAQKDDSDREKAKTKREGKDGRKWTPKKPPILCPACQHRKDVGKPLIEKCEACAALRGEKKPTEKEERKPKSGAAKFDDSKFDKLYGPLVVFFDNRARASGKGPKPPIKNVELTGDCHAVCMKLLEELVVAYKLWKKGT